MLLPPVKTGIISELVEEIIEEDNIHTPFISKFTYILGRLDKKFNSKVFYTLVNRILDMWGNMANPQTSQYKLIYNTGAELYNDNKEGFIEIIEVLIKRGFYDMAESIIKQNTVDVIEHIDVYSLIANDLIEQNKKDEAEQYLYKMFSVAITSWQGQSIKETIDFLFALSHIAFNMYNIKGREEALSMLRKVMQKTVKLGNIADQEMYRNQIKLIQDVISFYSDKKEWDEIKYAAEIINNNKNRRMQLEIISKLDNKHEKAISILVDTWKQWDIINSQNMQKIILNPIMKMKDEIAYKKLKEFLSFIDAHNQGQYYSSEKGFMKLITIEYIFLLNEGEARRLYKSLWEEITNAKIIFSNIREYLFLKVEVITSMLLIGFDDMYKSYEKPLLQEMRKLKGNGKGQFDSILYDDFLDSWIRKLCHKGEYINAMRKNNLLVTGLFDNNVYYYICDDLLKKNNYKDLISYAQYIYFRDVYVTDIKEKIIYHIINTYCDTEEKAEKVLHFIKNKEEGGNNDGRNEKESKKVEIEKR